MSSAGKAGCLGGHGETPVRVTAPGSIAVRPCGPSCSARPLCPLPLAGLGPWAAPELYAQWLYLQLQQKAGLRGVLVGLSGHPQWVSYFVSLNQREDGCVSKGGRGCSKASFSARVSPVSSSGSLLAVRPCLWGLPLGIGTQGFSSCALWWEGQLCTGRWGSLPPPLCTPQALEQAFDCVACELGTQRAWDCSRCGQHSLSGTAPDLSDSICKAGWAVVGFFSVQGWERTEGEA